MLMPAAVLIVMVLGAIAVDLTAVRLGQRELIAAAGDAANDAVTVGLDEAALRSGQGYRLDPDRAGTPCSTRWPRRGSSTTSPNRRP